MAEAIPARTAHFAIGELRHHVMIPQQHTIERLGGGYQFLGTRYVLPDGRAIEGMSILDVETRASSRRIIGRIRGTAELWGERFDLVRKGLCETCIHKVTAAALQMME